MSNPTSYEATRALWLAHGLPEDFLTHLKFTGDADSAINSSFRLGTAAQAAIGLSGLSAAYVHFLKTGVKQDVTIDARHAMLSFHSEQLYTVDGQVPGQDVWHNIAGLYGTKDGGFVRIHTNFPHHRAGILSILSLSDIATRDDVAAVLSEWDAVEFETATIQAGMCASALRSFSEWDAHPHAQALKGVIAVDIQKVGEAPRKVLNKSHQRPLENVRVLDLSRVLAGPIAGRTLAAHGASVLLVTAPSLPALPLLDTETSIGKHTTQLDLPASQDNEKLKKLAGSADVFLQAYRPGGLEQKGFGVQDLLELNPAIISANLRAWGWDGVWNGRRGFDSLVQTATGFNYAEGEAYLSHLAALHPGRRYMFQPRPFPVQALDHAAGYLLAFGVNAALAKAINDGGAYEVRVSLTAVGQWVRSLGRLSPQQAFGAGRPLPTEPLNQEVVDLSVEWRESSGKKNAEERRTMRTVKHAAVLSKTPAKQGEKDGVDAPMGLAAHDAEWF
ncbi:CoA-transferase family III domain-containing protein [Crucibulum laeve]|uniref:CoA-transferase family III domain-containing protein n=1 Tax=Crucibulum laeve TaxID=68775 RepID=A0A5C3M5F5_9AGAR|nr:CoA-transferase family III domain-containing protein [Crucibulum laeve]